MDNIDKVRRFNRFYTRQMAFFSRDYVSSGLSVTEIRILREIAEGGVHTAREISRVLEVDEGYLSRVIRNFVAEGWLVQRRSDADARRKILEVTKAGQALFNDLRDRTRADIAERVDKRDLPMIVAAMERVETYMSDLDPEAVEIRGLQPGDIGWLTQRHGELYVSEFGYDENFERYAAEILFEFQKRFDPATHKAFIASHGNVPLGSVFCEPGDSEGWAKLRVFFVEPAARGLGLGQRLMDACLGFARHAGYENMELYTLDNLTTARRLYGRNGFTCTGTTPQHFCGRDAVEEYWARAL